MDCCNKQVQMPTEKRVTLNVLNGYEHFFSFWDSELVASIIPSTSTKFEQISLCHGLTEAQTIALCNTTVAKTRAHPCLRQHCLQTVNGLSQRFMWWVVPSAIFHFPIISLVKIYSSIVIVHWVIELFVFGNKTLCIRTLWNVNCKFTSGTFNSGRLLLSYWRTECYCETEAVVDPLDWPT